MRHNQLIFLRLGVAFPALSLRQRQHWNSLCTDTPLQTSKLSSLKSNLAEQENFGRTSDVYTCNGEGGKCRVPAQSVFGHTTLSCHLHHSREDQIRLDTSVESAVHYAARLGHIEVIDCVYQRGVSINALNKEGDTPLHTACRHGQAKTVSFLCGLYSDVNQTNEKGETPLHVAVCEGYIDVVQCLLAAGGDPDLVDKHGCSSLHIALRRHYVKIAIVLLHHGSNIDLVDNLGDAPIHIAAKAGILIVAQTLCAFGCKVDFPNKSRQHPLYLAAKNGHTEVVRCLCLAGCDVEQKNMDGIAAEISAHAQGHSEIGELLSQLKNVHVREEYIAQLIPSTRPLSKIKLKLFGHSGVGKSTFIESIKSGFLTSWFRKSIAPTIATPKLKREDGPTKCSIELSSPGVDEKPLSFDTRLETYTQGVEVQHVTVTGAGDVSLWEYSGHEPYFMMYDHFIGNTNCVHLVLFNLSDPYEVQVQQVLFWVAFLLARIPPQEPLGLCGRSGKTARVALVATHADVAQCPRVPSTGCYASGESASVLRVAKLVFGRSVDIYDEVFVVDDHVGPNEPALRSLKNYVALNKDKVTQGLPKSTGFLESTCSILPMWRKAKVCFPALPWQDFVQLVREDVNPLAGDEHMRELIQQLQIMGEVLYLTCEDQDMVILEPNWLGTTIMGYLLSHDNQQKARVTGIYSADDIQLLFPEAEGTTLLQMLEAIELCTGCETDGEVEYEFPCFNMVETLDGLWTKDESKYAVYGGVRLQCRHKHLLGPLFPRLQVHFRRSAIKSGDPDADLYQWRSGSKFCSGSVEALVTLDSTGEAFEIKVRGPVNSRLQCFYFQEDLIAVVEQMLRDVCPGLLIERHLISSAQLRRHALQAYSYPPPTTVTALLQDGIHAELGNPYVADMEIESLFDLAFFGAIDVFNQQKDAKAAHPQPTLVLLPDMPASQLSILSLQCLCSVLDSPDPMGRDWCMFGVILGMTDRLPRLDPGDNPAFSPTAALMAEWTKRSDSTIGQLVVKLEKLERTDAVEQLVSTLPLFSMGRACCSNCDVQPPQ